MHSNGRKPCSRNVGTPLGHGGPPGTVPGRTRTAPRRSGCTRRSRAFSNRRRLLQKRPNCSTGRDSRRTSFPWPRRRRAGLPARLGRQTLLLFAFSRPHRLSTQYKGSATSWHHHLEWLESFTHRSRHAGLWELQNSCAALTAGRAAWVMERFERYSLLMPLSCRGQVDKSLCGWFRGSGASDSGSEELNSELAEAHGQPCWLGRR